MIKRQTISLTPATKTRLDALFQGRGDSYEQIIKRLLDEKGASKGVMPWER
jgi:hypothetical protein